MPSEVRIRAFLLLSLTLSSGAFVFTGAMVHMIELMRGLGHPAASAVLLASLIGPSQVTVRVFELLFGHRYSIMNSAVFGSAMLALGLGVALIDGGNFVVALVCIVVLRHRQRTEGRAARHPAARPVRPRPVRRLHGPPGPAAGHRLGVRAAGHRGGAQPASARPARCG